MQHVIFHSYAWKKKPAMIHCLNVPSRAHVSIVSLIFSCLVTLAHYKKWDDSLTPSQCKMSRSAYKDISDLQPAHFPTNYHLLLLNPRDLQAPTQKSIQHASKSVVSCTKYISWMEEFWLQELSWFSLWNSTLQQDRLSSSYIFLSVFLPSKTSFSFFKWYC